jgi:hypothetical protein
VAADRALAAWDRRNAVVDEFACHGSASPGSAGFRPDCRSPWLVKRAGAVVYDGAFTSDAIGRRVTPQAAPERRTHLALFAGCSFTAGQGVSDEETLPARFAARVPGYRVLNYGVSGAGPQRMVSQIESHMSPAAVGPYAGRPILVYTAIGDHIGRATGSRYFVGTYASGFPSYAPRPEGGVRLEGTFADAHPFRVAIARSMEASALLRRLPIPTGETDVELTTRIVELARERYLERFPQGRFLVLAFPGKRLPPFVAVLTRLQARGVDVLDMRNVFQRGERGIRFDDGHPSAEAYERVAARLAAELASRGWLET